MSKERKKRSDLLLQFWPKLLIPFIALVLIVIHMLWSSLQIDAITVGLLIFATLPWIWARIQNLELTGVGRVELREIKGKVEQAQSEIQSQRTQIEQLYALSMASEAFNQLKKLDTGSFGGFYLDPDLNAGLATELNYLKLLGYIKFDRAPGIVDTRDLPKRNNPNDDLSRYISVTKQGHDFVALREQVLKNA